jgi:putative sugar O-methyltransferase
MKRRMSNPFDIPADEAMLADIVADASANGGDLVPNAHWTLDREQVMSLQDLLDPLVGVIGMQPVDANAVACFEKFLRGIDHLGLCGGDLLAQGRSCGWCKTDLGTLMDLNLTTAYLPTPGPERLNVIEVGGGYGRLAEAFLRIRPHAAHYLMVDAVPASLMYAYLYLRREFPGRRIGSFYAGDSYDPDFDCYVMPAWHTPNLAGGQFDLAVNIESMQEMDRHHIEYYLGLFDRVTVPAGTIYISNARDYYYKGDWPFPDRWEVLFLHNTPRSWTRNHPTIAIRKGTADFRLERLAQEAAFEIETGNWNQGLSMLLPQ